MFEGLSVREARALGEQLQILKKHVLTHVPVEDLRERS
jgi:hypothetical protein